MLVRRRGTRRRSTLSVSLPGPVHKTRLGPRTSCRRLQHSPRQRLGKETGATCRRARRRSLDGGSKHSYFGTGGATGAGGTLRVAMLDRFQLLSDDDLVSLAPGSARLLAFLALARRSVHRLVVATNLWPEASENHAYGNLRAVLGRLPARGRAALEVGQSQLRLAECVSVDLDEARALAHRLLDLAVPPAVADLSTAAVAALFCELLCDWYDDWAIVEAEDWRQLRLHALEALAGYLTEANRFGQAVIAARAAVRADPLRESAHVVLAQVHLAEGNQSEARREFERYRALLNAELRLEPTRRFCDLVGM